MHGAWTDFPVPTTIPVPPASRYHASTNQPPPPPPPQPLYYGAYSGLQCTTAVIAQCAGMVLTLSNNARTQ
ncbi:unnamed protein product [Ambrosiozyma monospora]|uniref:Unnamed protein product n=1 Tax=Ambrosiozyma monospora TaxID=43982 RepID=A0ACB5SVG9_AMBMO|nr:unnamed protein product [Ambrosiozyma monospora]